MPSYREGDVIIKSEPWIYIVQGSWVDKVCNRCLRNPAGKPLNRCSGCKFAHYCSTACQENDWKDRHQPECRSLQQITRTHFDMYEVEAFRIICQIVTRLQRGQLTDENGGCQPPTKRSYNDLMSHDTHVSALEGLRTVYERYATYYKRIGHGLVEDYADFVHMYGKFVVNGWGITINYHSVGKGLYLGPSRFNHSCEPSARNVYDGKAMMVKAVRDIDAGEEVTLAYIDTFSPTEIRQDLLKRRYFFDCLCAVCTDPRRTALRNAAKCVTEGCSAIIPLDDRVTWCVICGQDNTERMDRAKTLLSNVTQELVIVEKKQARELNLQHLLTMANDDAVKVLHPTNFLLGIMCNSLAELLKSDANEKSAVDLVGKALPSIRMHCHKYDDHHANGLRRTFTWLWKTGQKGRRMVELAKDLEVIYRFVLCAESYIYKKHMERIELMKEMHIWDDGVKSRLLEEEPSILGLLNKTSHKGFAAIW